jgi:hypothetical protein
MNPDERLDSEQSNRFPDLARFGFVLSARDPIRLPEFAGSAWRGLLGHGLRRTACVTRQPTCTGCLLIHSCAYSLIFETPPPPGQDLTGFTAVSHPYALDIDPRAPRCYQPGEQLILGMTLIGPAITQAPYLIHAMTIAGQLGFGREGNRFRVVALFQEAGIGSGDWVPVYEDDHAVFRPLPTPPLDLPPPPAQVRLSLLTPLRIKRDGRFVKPQDFTPRDLFRNLYNRLKRLALLNGGQPETFDWATAAPLMDGLQLQAAKLRWHDWTRYSNRQETPMQLGGLMGELTLSGPALPTVWPALWYGQWAHVGKATAFGLGNYRLGSAS